MSDPLPELLANMDRLEDRLARALWLANGNRADLWDNEHDDGWRLYMQQAKAEYRERTQRFLAAFPPAEPVDDTERLRSDGQSQGIYREWAAYRSEIEGDPFAKDWPDWLKGRVAILGYAEQGFRICEQPSGRTLGSGAWGDLIVEYADGSLGVQHKGEASRG